MFNWIASIFDAPSYTQEEHRVLDDYERNRVLVDLTAQPDDIKKIITDTIAENSVKKQIPMVGAKFLKFCGKYELNRLSDNADKIAECLSASYPDDTL